MIIICMNYTFSRTITFPNESLETDFKAKNVVKSTFLAFGMNIVYALFYALLLKVSHSKGFEVFEVMLLHRLWWIKSCIKIEVLSLLIRINLTSPLIVLTECLDNDLQQSGAIVE